MYICKHVYDGVQNTIVCEYAEHSLKRNGFSYALSNLIETLTYWLYNGDNIISKRSRFDMNHYATDYMRVGEALNIVECRLYQLDYQMRHESDVHMEQWQERQMIYALLQAVYVRLYELNEIDDVTLVCKHKHTDLSGATAVLTFRTMYFISDQVVRRYPSDFEKYWSSRITIEQFTPLSDAIWQQLNDAMQQKIQLEGEADVAREIALLQRFLTE